MIDAAAMLADLYLMPPIFAETSNYLEETKAAEIAYLQVFGHNALRGLFAGSIFLVMSVFGIVTSFRRTSKELSGNREAILICQWSTACLGAVIFILLGLPWQRYLIPLVPLACLWSAYGIAQIVDQLANVFALRRA